MLNKLLLSIAAAVIFFATGSAQSVSKRFDFGGGKAAANAVKVDAKSTYSK
jgi:hypothetical protein